MIVKAEEAIAGQEPLEEEDDDSFGDSFNRASSNSDADTQNGDDADTQNVSGEGQDDSGAEDKGEDETYKHKYETLQGMFNRLSKEFEELKKGATAGADRQEANAAGTITNTAEKQDDDIAEFMEQFDYLAKPMQKIMERFVTKAIDEAVTKTRGEMTTQIAATNRAVADFMITSAHPDFYTMRDSGEVKKWVEGLTGKDKTLYTKVYEDGSVNEVIDMLSEYKKTISKAKEAKEEKLKNLTAVKTKPGAISLESGQKPDDFEGSFAKRAAELEKQQRR